MKRTLMLTMLATALLGGQVFAKVTGTDIDGDVESSGSKYYGSHTTSESETATGGNVTIKKDPAGEVPDTAEVYGGRSENAGAFNNTVIMSGGTVRNIRGGEGKNGEVSNNVVIVTGGSSTGTVYGGWVNTYHTMSNNRVHLVGCGAHSVTIADGLGNLSEYNYTGDENGISLQNLVAAAGTSVTSSTGNTIDVYGSGIKLSGSMTGMQILTFNITNEQMTEQTTEAALTHTHTKETYALKLTGVVLQIKDLDVKEWTPGKTITLVQSTQAIQGLEDDKMVDITDATGTKVAQGKLQLVNGTDGKHLLNLTVQGNVPEPTTGTLSLLALTALAARRRRK